MLRGVQVRIEKECHQLFETEAGLQSKKCKIILPSTFSSPTVPFHRAGLNAEGFSSSLNWKRVSSAV